MLLDDKAWPKFLRRRIRGTDWPVLASATRSAFVLDGPRRFQFSVWNLMLMMVPLAVVFGLASQVAEKGWVVWLCAVVIGGALAVGALIGGWSGMRRGFSWCFAAIVLVQGTLQLKQALVPSESRGFSLTSALDLEQFMLVNPYGLFRQMTEARPEIIIEGSDDGENWKPYEFRWKPGDLSRPPAFCTPHQPRLDWQMWFAALGHLDPWFQPLIKKLLEGEPRVLALLADNPFSDAPPKFIRIVLYQYHFTDSDERRKTGNWWRREQVGASSEISLTK
jgi:lipase maturation factor